MTIRLAFDSNILRLSLTVPLSMGMSFRRVSGEVAGVPPPSLGEAEEVEVEVGVLGVLVLEEVVGLGVVVGVEELRVRDNSAFTEFSISWKAVAMFFFFSCTERVLRLGLWCDVVVGVVGVEVVVIAEPDLPLLNRLVRFLFPAMGFMLTVTLLLVDVRGELLLLCALGSGDARGVVEAEEDVLVGGVGLLKSAKRGLTVLVVLGVLSLLLAVVESSADCESA